MQKEQKCLDTSGLDEDEDTILKIISSDGVSFNFDIKSAKLSKYIETILGDPSCKCITLKSDDVDLSHTVISLIKEYFDIHSDGVVPEDNLTKRVSNSFYNSVKDKKDVKFIEDSVMGGDDNIKKLLSLLKASNYLDIKPLLNMCALKVASLIKGKEPCEIEKIFAK